MTPTRFALAFAAALAAIAVPAAGAQRADRPNPTITLFEHPNFQGRSFLIDGDAPDLRWVQFNDLTSSILIEGGQWEVCLEPDYRGTCQVLDADQPDMTPWAFNERISSIRAVHQPRRDRREGVTLFSEVNYAGRSVNLVRAETDLGRFEFNDAAASIQIHSGDWTLCEHADFGGRCVDLDRDSNHLELVRMARRASSIAPAGYASFEPAPAPLPGPGYGGPDGFRPGDTRIAGGVRGVNSMFFPEPRVGGAFVERCLTRTGRACDQVAADSLCQDAGFSRAAWYEVASRGRDYYYLDEGRIAPGRGGLVDVMCVR